MIAFPDMLVPAAVEAGIKVPADPEDFEMNEFPHWGVFLTCQIGAPMPSPDAHWTNAVIIASIPEDKIRLITAEEIINLGFLVGSSYSTPNI